jgi:hypothetical protein
MKKQLLIIALAGAIVAQLSCTKKCDCWDGGLDIAFKGVTIAEADTILLRRYQKEKGFTVVTDSLLISPANSGYDLRTDTLYITILGGSPYLVSTYNYELVVPGLSATYRLNDYTEEKKEELCMVRNQGCRNIITSLKFNNTVIYPIRTGSGIPVIYIRK